MMSWQKQLENFSKVKLVWNGQNSDMKQKLSDQNQRKCWMWVDRLWWELDTRDKQWPNHLGVNSRMSIKNNALENRDTAEAFYTSHWTLVLYIWKPNLFAHQQFQWHHKRVERGTEFHHICVPWLAGCIFVHWWLALSFIWLQFLTSTVCDITAISSPSSVLLTVCSVAVSTARCFCLTTKSAL